MYLFNFLLFFVNGRHCYRTEFTKFFCPLCDHDLIKGRTMLVLDGLIAAPSTDSRNDCGIP